MCVQRSLTSSHQLPQVGLNGVDNGAIRFTHVRVPRENLLDRFASVDRAGRYSSPLPSAGKRFAATLGELTGGRVGLTAGSLGVLKVTNSFSELSEVLDWHSLIVAFGLQCMGRN